MPYTYKTTKLKKPGRIKVINNWENLYWEIAGVEVTAALFKVTLEMPDKSVETFKVSWTEHQTSYSDMGHTCYASQLNAFITLVANGIKLKTNLNDIKHRVKIIEYKVRRP